MRPNYSILEYREGEKALKEGEREPARPVGRGGGGACGVVVPWLGWVGLTVGHSTPPLAAIPFLG